MTEKTLVVVRAAEAFRPCCEALRTLREVEDTMRRDGKPHTRDVVRHCRRILADEIRAQADRFAREVVPELSALALAERRTDAEGGKA